MSQKGRTPDEKFLIQLYKSAEAISDDPLAEMDSRKIALAIGQKESEVKNIIKLLAKAKFIQKVNETTIMLTPHGHHFVRNELGLTVP